MREKKYIVTEHPGTNYLPFQSKNNIHLSLSPQSCDTTFSSYSNKQYQNSSKFVGLKLKFDSEDSDSSCQSGNSGNSIWKPVFKKKKLI